MQTETVPVVEGTELADAAPGQAGPRLEVAIHILADGSVVFGDLPSDLAEVARILTGEPPAAPTQTSGDCQLSGACK